MPPLEFVVEGTPKSVQSRGKNARWVAAVRAAAAAAVPDDFIPALGALRVRLVFCHRGTNLDLDNIIKPILDAMTGIVYSNDEQIIDLIASKRTFASVRQLKTPPSRLVRAIGEEGKEAEFVFISVAAAVKEELP